MVKERILDIDAAHRSNLKEDDSRLTPVTTRLKVLAQSGPGDITFDVRQELRSYQALAHMTADAAFVNVRSLRNLLIVVGVLVCVGLRSWPRCTRWLPAL
jgi:hypothetical protein